MKTTLAKRAFLVPSSSQLLWKRTQQSPISPRILSLWLGSFSTMPDQSTLSENSLRTNESVAVSGILFSRSVRSSFASFTLAPPNGPPFLVRLQFLGSIQELRSFCRRQYKIGDQIGFLGTGRWEQPPPQQQPDLESASTAAPSWSGQPRWVVDLSSVGQAETSVVVQEARVWSMKVCQQHQLKYIAPKKNPKRKQQAVSRTNKPKRANGGADAIGIEGNAAAKNQSHDNGVDNDTNHDNNKENTNAELLNNNNHHGGGKEKRLQAQELVSFLVHLVGSQLVGTTAEKASTLEERIHHQQRIRNWFNRADGVLDVAGGCGHVSMALGMEGISSTVVDARASVGKLPKRDRKIWKKSLKNNNNNNNNGSRRPATASQIANIQRNIKNGNNENDSSVENNVQPQNQFLSNFEYCQPVVPAPAVVPVQSQQAWFGSKPDGYDASFRHPDEADIPILVATPASSMTDSSTGGNDSTPDQGNHPGSDSSKTTVLRKQVSALVALHPDEATGEIVEQAVKHRIPFVIVPCCVFARLFPHRITNDGRPVSSYEDLLDFLQGQDPSIQRTRLSFGGKNIALWSVFPDG